MEVVLTGAGCVLPEVASSVDVRAFLPTPKMRKFMAPQDRMAVAAAGLALAEAGLARPLGERAGLFLAVGPIPFDESDLAAVVDSSVEQGAFSMARFSTDGMRGVRPLVTFRCLPNMPAFHVSACFDLQGPYSVVYPGPGQLYLALEQALMALETGRIDRALVGGVAHQRNFLVQHHLGRLDPDGQPPELADAGGFVVLETREAAEGRGAPIRGDLLDWSVRYTPHDPWERGWSLDESFEPRPAGLPDAELGPASLPVALALADGCLLHRLSSRDGISASSRWSLR
jgi:3-oxoacyl-(acyl-carrier-protein) synthase